MIVAVIPARSGSKRIPDKNIRDFCGQPIIKYSIDAAHEANVFDRVIVSTDCSKIAELAVECGAEVPFLRPENLAGDFTPTIPVIQHAIDWLNKNEGGHEKESEDKSGSKNGRPTSLAVSYACCIYATAPFVSPADIRCGLDRLQSDPASEFAFPITTFPFPIFRSLKRAGDQVEMFFPQFETTRSQDLPEAWHDAGQFYWGTAKAWHSSEGVYSSRSIGIPVPRHRVQDIDTPEDRLRAESMFMAQQKLAHG